MVGHISILHEIPYIDQGQKGVQWVLRYLNVDWRGVLLFHVFHPLLFHVLISDY